MAGRAGRRGIDTIGHVIHCNNLFETPILTEYQTILCGKPQKLISKFHINYSMILNLIKSGTHIELDSFVKQSMIFNELQ
jgi:superfamily II RNA helicase